MEAVPLQAKVVWGVSILAAIMMGTQMAGLFGPILYGCQMVLKIWVGVGESGFGVGPVYEFVGYTSGCCL